ncbi:MAG: FAD binding domain-containing protein [Halolamina sp.]|uniref:FAD binding domain-containing protein n=1 Tax=Halolamina sp. TaxID=1940283 RepID=UPI002FC34633
MFPPAFDYRKPADLDTALAALAAEDAVALAGGHDLVPTLKQREESPGTVVDLGALERLRGVARERSAAATGVAGALTIGALTTYADLLDAEPTGVDGLLDATAAVGDKQIRNRGTVGGNLAAAHPASDIPAAALVADATLQLVGPGGERTLPVEEFYDVDGETVCRGDELLTELTLHTKPDRASAYVRKTHPSSGYAAIGVAARVDLDGSVVEEARVAVNGLTPRPTRLTGVEEALIGVSAGEDSERPNEAVADAADRAGAGVDPDRVRADHLVAAEQRRRLLPSYTERAVSQALARAADRAGVSA